MSTAIAGKKLSTKPAEPDDRQRARKSKRHPDVRSPTIKLTAHANIACVIVGPRQSSSRRDRRNGHPDCRCVPIQIVALHSGDLRRMTAGHPSRISQAPAWRPAKRLLVESTEMMFPSSCPKYSCNNQESEPFRTHEPRP